MSTYFHAVISGRLGNVRHDQTKNGNELLELSFVHDQYDGTAPNGESMRTPIWVRATFWNGERQEVLSRLGDHMRGTITLSGEFYIRSYKNRNGNSGIAYEVKRPRLVDFIPSRPREEEQINTATVPANMTPDPDSEL